jgi:hypothetical protein
MRKNSWEQEGKSVSYFETKRMLPIWKESKPELNSIHSQVLQDVVLRVNLAFKAFWMLHGISLYNVLSTKRQRLAGRLYWLIPWIRLKCAQVVVK